LRVTVPNTQQAIETVVGAAHEAQLEHGFPQTPKQERFFFEIS
jgi:hypothetical protein